MGCGVVLPDVALPTYPGCGVLLPDVESCALPPVAVAPLGGLFSVNMPSLYCRSGPESEGVMGPEAEYRVLGIVLLVYVSALPVGSSLT